MQMIKKLLLIFCASCIPQILIAQITYNSGSENKRAQSGFEQSIPIYKNAEAFEIIERGFIVSVLDMLEPTPSLFTKKYTVIWQGLPYDCQVVYNLAGIYADCMMLPYMP